MMKFNYNLFKSNCNSLSKQFNQVHSTCVVYHDICQQSVVRPLSKTTTNLVDACNSDQQHQKFNCQKQTCSNDQEINSTDDCKTFSTNSDNHHHHHNHVNGLIYSKRVRSILLLNALLSKPNNVKGANSISSDNCLDQSSPLIKSKWQACTEQIRNYAKKAGSKEKKKGSRKLHFSDEELSQCIDLANFRNDLDDVINNLKNDFVNNINIRIGSNIELLNVDVDGETYVLKDIARITKKNNLISIDLVDLPEFAVHVMKAIRESGMNVNPQQDGLRIYFQQAKSTKEHRELLAKSCKTILQKAKDSLKSVQNNYIGKANLKKEDRISIDVIANCCEYIRYETQEAINACSELYDQKVKQLLE